MFMKLNAELAKVLKLEQNKEDLSKNRLGKMALKNNEKPVNVHMGIMAQDIQKYDRDWR